MLINFDNLHKDLKFRKNEVPNFVASYWWTTLDGCEINIQGNANNCEEKYIKIAKLFIENSDKYLDKAVRHLKSIIRLDYEYYCHSVYFHEFCHGMSSSKTKKGGFEMFFWQDKPDDDRYVNFVIQFSESGNDIGLRIFSM